MDRGVRDRVVSLTLCNSVRVTEINMKILKRNSNWKLAPVSKKKNHKKYSVIGLYPVIQNSEPCVP